MSKSFGLSGLRIGWIVAPRSIIDAFLHIRYYTTVTAPIIEQKIAVVAHRHRERLMGRNQVILDNNYAYLKQWMEERNGLFNWVKPKGGPVTFPKFSDDINTDEFCFQLVKDHSVLLVPGNYGFGAEGFIRIGYGESRKFEEAMSRVGDALENFLV